MAVDNTESAVYFDVKSDIPKFNGASLPPGNVELLQIQSIGVYKLQLRQGVPEQPLLDMGWDEEGHGGQSAVTDGGDGALYGEAL
jgi:hypothetical protein